MYNNFNTQCYLAVNGKNLPSGEFAGIADDVLSANVEIIPDVEFDPVTNEVTGTPLADALGRKFTRFGHQARPQDGAIAFVNEDGTLWQAKLLGQDPTGKRSGRYLAEEGIGDVPFLATIPSATARAIAANISPACEASWLECEANGGLFWDFVKGWKQIPIIVTEGAKKALAAISQEHIALSLYGCGCGKQWTDDGYVIKPALLPYVEGRKVIIAFDQDSKSETVTTVRNHIGKLVTALTNANATPRIMEWNGAIAKGLDDLIAADPDLFHHALENTLSPAQWRLKQAFDLTPIVSLRLNCPDLTKALKLDIPNKLIAIKSPKKTYKTGWLAQQIEPHLRNGGKVIVPVHREQLAKELGNRLGLEYRTELTREGKIFGYALCVDSLHPKANPPFHPDDWENCWLILDEIDQVIWHLLNSDTCKYNRTAIFNSLAELLNVADKIFLTSADLNKACIDFIQGLLINPTEPFVVVNDYQHPSRACTSYDKPKELYDKLLEEIRSGRKVIIHTGGQKEDSQWGSFNLEEILRNTFADLKILRIDGVTVAETGHPALGIMGNINEALKAYDVVIASPTLETGISIESDHFDAVFCFATGSQTVDAIGQTIERVRADVPRYICVVERATMKLIGCGSDSAYALANNLLKSAKLNKQLTEADNYARIELDAKGNIVKTWAIFAAHHNLGFRNYRESVHKLLRSNGFDVTFTSRDVPDGLGESVKAQAELNHVEYCERVASAPIIKDPKEYKELANKRAKTQAERDTVTATAIANKYATDTIDADLVDKDSDPLWYGRLRLHYRLTVGAEFVKDADTSKIQALAESNGEIFTPDFNRACRSAKIAALSLPDIDVRKFLVPDRLFTNEDPELVEWHRVCCRHYREIKTYTGIKIQSDPNAQRNRPVDVLRKFLRAIGLKIVCVGKESTGDQNRIYQIASLDPDGRGEIFARWLERDRQMAEAPAPQSIGDVFCLGNSTESNRQKSLISISPEKNNSFLPINNRTDEENLKKDTLEPTRGIDQNEFAQDTDQIFSILGWGADRAREFLRQNFENEDRRLFSQDQMSSCWNLLLLMLDGGQGVNYA
jgi:hypothetical protein